MAGSVAYTFLPFSSSKTQSLRPNLAPSMVKKRRRRRRRVGYVASSGGGVVLPAGFLDPIVSTPPLALPAPAERNGSGGGGGVAVGTCKQFRNGGDYVGAPVGDWDSHTGGMDHVRVHPKFMHSNATSHKWALGAFAELLDNALDELIGKTSLVYLNSVADGSVARIAGASRTPKAERSVEHNLQSLPAPEFRAYLVEPKKNAVACKKTVYPIEKVAADGEAYHKSCFRCSHGRCVISPSNYITHEHRLYCRHHHSQLFKQKGNFSQLDSHCFLNGITKDASLPNGATKTIPSDVVASESVVTPA